MDRSDLLSQLENAKNNYILGLAAISLFGTEESYSILEKNHASFGQYTLKFDQVANLLRDENDRSIAVKEFLKMLLRALIKESFELIKDYCEDTGQSALFKSEPWYQFARMIRNCLSHNFRFEFKNYDKSLLPVTWRTRTITLSMDGQPLGLRFFGYVQTWELFQDFQDFAENRLA
ncbi:MAG TPA: hypothetical protein ENI39_01385 [Anaerolineae bacterium]|nr:hypothetical protein [Anaerolineae bacterium]